MVILCFEEEKCMELTKMQKLRDDALERLYEKDMNHIINLLEFMEVSMMCWVHGIESEDEHQGRQVYQFCRAITVFRSCKLLISQGCATNALALSRTIQDITVLSSWVAKDPEVRFKLLQEKNEKEKVYSAKRLVKNNVPNLPENIKEYAKKDPRNMARIPSIESMANEIGLQHMYATAFTLSSAYLHNHGAELVYTALQQGKERVVPNVLPSEENVNLAWLTLYVSMKTCWRLFGDFLQKPIEFNWALMDKTAGIVNERNNETIGWAAQAD
jgi:hypothetical protein